MTLKPHMLAQVRWLAEQLQGALDSRGVIDRAVGILMSRGGLTEYQALTQLRTLSQHQHREQVIVAQGIVDEEVRRARTRDTPGHQPR